MSELMPIRNHLSFPLAALLLVVSGGLLPVLAQDEPTPAQLSKQFGEGFLKGCLASKVAGVKNQAGYCTCLATSYQTRYDGRSLNIISNLAAKLGDQGSALVTLMMMPEAKVCADKK